MRRRVWLVEDNVADVQLFRELLMPRISDCDLVVAEDGVIALKMLRGLTEPAEFPNLLIVDLNLPRMSGLQMLDRVNRDPNLRCIPTVVLSTSFNPDDEIAARCLGARMYLRKVSNLDAYLLLANEIEQLLSASRRHGSEGDPAVPPIECQSR